MKDYRDDEHNQRWWNEKILWGLSRNDFSLIAIGFALAVLYMKFPINWDFVFGFR